MKINIHASLLGHHLQHIHASLSSISMWYHVNSLHAYLTSAICHINTIISFLLCSYFKGLKNSKCTLRQTYASPTLAVIEFIDDLLFKSLMYIWIFKLKLKFVELLMRSWPIIHSCSSPSMSIFLNIAFLHNLNLCFLSVAATSNFSNIFSSSRLSLNRYLQPN